MILALYIAATIADIVTSVIARRNPRLGEGNLLRFAGAHWIIVRVALAVAIAVIVLNAPVPLWTLTFATVLFGAVAAWNVVQIVRVA